MKVHLRTGQRHFEVDVERDAEGFTVILGERTHRLRRAGTHRFVIADGHHRISVIADADRLHAAVGPHGFTFTRDRRDDAGHALGNMAAPEVVAPMPGKVTQVLVQTGDKVTAGDPLLILEAMKMENRLVAEGAAEVVSVNVAAGDMVDGGQVLIVLQFD